MTKCLLTLYQPDGVPSKEDVDLDSIGREIGALDGEIRAAGAWVYTAGLRRAATSTEVRARGDNLALTDSLYLKGREHVGGFTILEANDLDAALGWAGRIARVTGLAVEARPLERG